MYLTVLICSEKVKNGELLLPLGTIEITTEWSMN
jgi:hypothetical protein